MATDKKQIQVLTELVQRYQLAMQMGISFTQLTPLDEVLGYPQTISFEDYQTKWKRQDIANAIIERPIVDAWNGDVTVYQADEPEETLFEKEWKSMYETLKLRTQFINIDRQVGLGQYGIIFLGLSDAKTKEDVAKPVTSKNNKLLYVSVFNEKQATISTLNADVGSSRFGKPESYQINMTSALGETSLIVHHTRVIHIVDTSIDNIYGTPRLEAVYNRLMDVAKLSGGSAQMYWKGAFPGLHGDTKPNYTVSQPVRDDLDNQLNELERGLRRFVATEGIELKGLPIQVADPKNHFDIQIQLISAKTHIPKRILLGSERGELSSSQDSDEWSSYLESRRTQFIEAEIIRPFIQRCIEVGALPKVESFMCEWPPLHESSPEEKAKVGLTRAQSLKDYVSNTEAQMVMPPKAFYELCLGLDEDQIEMLNSFVDEFVGGQQLQPMENEPETDTEEETEQTEEDLDNV